jgi:hypothetical protein
MMVKILDWKAISCTLDYTCVLTLLLKARGFRCFIRLLCLKDQCLQIKKILLWTSPCISSQSRRDWKVPIREIWGKFPDKTNSSSWPSDLNFCDFFSLDFLEQRIFITEIKKNCDRQLNVEREIQKIPNIFQKPFFLNLRIMWFFYNCLGRPLWIKIQVLLILV